MICTFKFCRSYSIQFNSICIALNHTTGQIIVGQKGFMNDMVPVMSCRHAPTLLPAANRAAAL